MGSCASILAAVLSLASADGEMVRLPPVPASLSPEDPIFYESDESELFADARDEPDTLPGSQFGMTWLAAGGANGFGVFDLDLNHSWLFGYDDWPAFTITPGFGTHLWSGPRNIDLPPQVYDVYFDLQWQPVEAEWGGVSVGVIPGWYGDFERWDHDVFQLTGWLLAKYQVHDQLQLFGGLAYSRQVRSNLLPVGGIVWSPNEDTRIEILVPNPRFARRLFSSDFGTTWWYVGGQLGGGTWAVADTPNSNVLLAYNDFRLITGLESFRVGGCEWSVEVGYVFSREISVDDFVIDEPQNTFLFQATFAF